MLKNEIARRKEAGEALRVVAGKYGGDHSTIANVISGRCSPPPALLEGWAKLFDTPAERERFVRLGHLAHATPEVLAIVSALEAENASLRAELAGQVAASPLVIAPGAGHKPRKQLRTARSTEPSRA